MTIFNETHRSSRMLGTAYSFMESEAKCASIFAVLFFAVERPCGRVKVPKSANAGFLQMKERSQSVISRFCIFCHALPVAVARDRGCYSR